MSGQAKKQVCRSGGNIGSLLLADIYRGRELSPGWKIVKV